MTPHNGPRMNSKIAAVIGRMLGRVERGTRIPRAQLRAAVATPQTIPETKRFSQIDVHNQAGALARKALGRKGPGSSKGKASSAELGKLLALLDHRGWILRDAETVTVLDPAALIVFALQVERDPRIGITGVKQ